MKTIKLNKSVSLPSSSGPLWILKRNIYIFDFPQQKRTINIPHGYGNFKSVYEEIPPLTVLFNCLLNYDYSGYDYLIIGEVKDNILHGTKINGYRPWVCSPDFAYIKYKKDIDPYEEIKRVMNVFWNSPFPNYGYRSDGFLELYPLFDKKNHEK